MKESKVLMDKTLDWSMSQTPQRFRLVAVLQDDNRSFEGMDFIVEEWVGVDAMGNDQWKRPECISSLFVATIGQYLLEKDHEFRKISENK